MLRKNLLPRRYNDDNIEACYQECFQILSSLHFKTGHFVLSSGERSPYYVDVKSAWTNHTFMWLAVQVLYEEYKAFRPQSFHVSDDEEFRYPSIGGMESGALPILAVLAFKQQLNYFWVRKEKKEHGLEDMIIGNVRPPVIIVEDVLNSGKTVSKVAQAVGIENVKGILCVVNRHKAGDRINIVDEETWERHIVDVRQMYNLEQLVRFRERG
jgi:orotate phosphoribosyltransferase